jgi:2-phosphosulfolactate phosphatase
MARGPKGAPMSDVPFAATRDQSGWDVRFDWATEGMAAIGPGAAGIVVVDVLRFTTAVSVAVGRGAEVLPYVWDVGDAPRAYAEAHKAELAGMREDGGWSLSPTDLAGVPDGTRLVLPSPNGSTLAVGAGEVVPGVRVLAGCLRNAGAVGRVAAALAGPVAVVAAGERWRGALGPLRPSVEDLLGAGAVIDALVGAGRDPAGMSPEARAALAAFTAARPDLGAWLAGSASGRELAERGWAEDVACAAVLDAEDVAPVLDGEAFRAVTPAAGGRVD